MNTIDKIEAISPEQRYQDLEQQVKILSKDSAHLSEFSAQ